MESGLFLLLDEFSQTLMAVVRETTHSSTVRQAGFHTPSRSLDGLLKDSNGAGGGWKAENKLTVST